MKRLHGFSLMEMMIVLTIVAVVAAASAPMINKKLVRGASEKSPWVFVNGESIGYNIDNEGGIQDRKTATIGTNGRVPNGSNNPRLYIDTNSDTTPHILFGRQRGHLMRMIAGGDNDNVILSNDPQTSKNSVVIGPGTKASNDSQVVIGNSASSNSAHAISVGSYTEACAYDGIAIGHNAKVSSNALGSIAIGTSANTVSTGSIVIGSAKQDTGTSAVAIGYNAEAKGESSVSIRGKSDGVFAIALGEGSNANTKESIAIGYQATASNNINYPEDSLAGSTVLGAHATVFGANTTAIGRSSNVSGYYSSAFGYNSHAEEPKALAIGANTVAKGENSTALGYNAKAEAHNSTAIGYNAVATQENTIVLGDANTKVIIPGAVEFQNLVVQGGIDVRGNIRVGQRGYFGLCLDGYGYDNKSPDNWKGTTSLIFGAITKDDHNNEWVHDGGNSGHRRWMFHGITREENSNTAHIVNADQYDNETNVWANSTIRALVHENFAKFYKNIGLPNPRSDRRLKNVGKEFTSGLEKLKKLDLYNYTYKADKDKTPHVGVMAQDLQKIFPDAVVKGEDGFLRIRLEDMFYAVINAVKELDNRTSAQEKKIKELEKRIEELEKRK